MDKYREINIPGDVLADDNLSDRAKLLYGKIARMSFKEGFCWGSNSFLDETKAGKTASRGISELKKAGYIKIIGNNQYRKIYLCPVKSRVNKGGDLAGSSEAESRLDKSVQAARTDVSTKHPKRTSKRTSKENNIADDSNEPPISSLQKPAKHKKPPLREREPVNDIERVEKAYLQNWDLLYSQGRLKTPDPVFNNIFWIKTRKLLKNLFEQLDAETVIKALQNGLEDDWVINNGYSLGIMLSAGVLNRLINTSGKTTSKHRIGTDNVPKDKVSSYFREPTV